MIAYLDTHVVAWLAQGDPVRISPSARTPLETADLLVSPMVLLELEYLREINRVLFSSRELFLKVEYEFGVQVCDLPFAHVAEVALDEKWTRDPFDRTIVAQAKANGLALLVTADEEIRRNYPRAIW
ncbi:type II toxin-antitoxin system VapC family toxin [Silvibacterium dinghuense]|uniref:PIN domain-containing protein n=1 Tax=Silvibacterium dinghuense TaxID=1560006 RepID=A0A4V1NUT8_9BACT|nr:type II toxin-antitoxin system VapC family toxin [Silvibacterium dinghuense]RXS93388.1 PIN domain-containing protein [Silvibacterium dinghuense]GGH05412.1 hypothetical protein GCM10011586_21950 [Silvibacterium dinghuense]